MRGNMLWFAAWYLYKIVGQNMLRPCKIKKVFSEKKNWTDNSFDVQIEISDLLHYVRIVKWATILSKNHGPRSSDPFYIVSY